ncbi:uncharacterized protein F4822DRAFT_429792 [Hypoxylon trugodes]|uniref:uncharacterized protein n=1 Tax=Hypoxylon trugodes TaxID=326681 RepID=UPI002196459B|nr:uncharacterized protein F4822DRAFT_429792 [Hypoxylon trugodes]KAI1389179.1 hypothetical protein F4822DRAFT_429792 [Hypoxylon trugodes]
MPDDISGKQLRSPSFYSPPILHPIRCDCQECRLKRRFSLSSDLPYPYSPGNSEDEAADIILPKRPILRRVIDPIGDNNKVDPEPQKKQKQPSTPPTASDSLYPRPASMDYPDVYVYPKSVRHITFPVVDYSAGRQKRSPPDQQAGSSSSASRPSCYIAISPDCARPTDFEAALCPKGSSLIVVARLWRTQRTERLSMFDDVDDLREASIQLEVWDEDATKDYTNGNDTRNTSNGSKNGASKNKNKKGRT